MRVLLATDCFDPEVGGVQRVVKDLAGRLVSLGHDTEVLTRAGVGLPPVQDIDGVTVRRVQLGRPALTLRAAAGFVRRYPRAAGDVHRVCRELKPDVINVHFVQGPLTYLALPSARRHRAALVCSVHGRDVNELVLDDPVGRWVVRKALRAAAAVTAPSEASLAEARAVAGRVGETLYRAVPNMIPNDVARLLDTPIEVGDGSVLAIGELHERNGFDVLIRAAALLRGVRFRIAGGGEGRERFQRLAAELGVEDRVELLGPVDRENLAGLLRRASVLAVCSRLESFGLVLLEGFAAGLATVATRVGGIPEVVGDSGAAELVEAGHVEEFAGTLKGLLDDPARRRTLAERGRARAREFDGASMVDAYLSVYRDARARNARQDGKG